MADTLYTRALVRAAEIQGSTQALASLLRVPENTLLRWMSGRAQMPLQAFLKVIEVVAQYEKTEALELHAEATSQGEKLRFRIGELEAHCAKCEGPEFVAAQPGALRYTSKLVCVACGESVVHGNLISQLAKDAVRQSKAMTAARAKRVAERATKSAELRPVKKTG
jgi:DNA-binding transcriptional regulator YdaS (Cro superfamily)